MLGNGRDPYPPMQPSGSGQPLPDKLHKDVHISDNYGAKPEDNSPLPHEVMNMDLYKKDDAPQNPAAYMDWASNLFVDPGHDILSSYDFSQLGMPSNNHIMQKIQFQNSVHDQPDKLQPQLQQQQLQQQQHQPQTHPGPAPSAPYPRQGHPAALQLAPLLRPLLIPAEVVKSKPRRPCDHCRRRKTKCVIIPGTQTCAQCETKSIDCTYSDNWSKEEHVAKRMRTQEYATDLAAALSLSDIVPPNVPIRTVAPVQDYSIMNNSLLKKTLSLQFPRSSFYIGPTSYLFDTNLLEAIISSQNTGQSSNRSSSFNKIEQVNLSDSISLRKVDNKTQFVLKDDQTKQSFQNMSSDVDSIEKFIAPHGQILIDLYFRIIHPSYPILHKKVFLEKYSRTHREFSAPLLAAVYALAIQWWDYDPQLNRFPKPNVELVLKIGLNNYILEILKRPKLSAVQAGLLLLQCKHILRDISVANHSTNTHSLASASLTSSFNDSDYNDWVLCSQVVALSEELGLGLDCDGWKLPKWERGLRKRLAWAVYMEEKWLSLKNSRPSHINEDNWVVLELAEEDFPEKHGDGDLKEGSSDINNGKKIFMNLISLSQIVSEISTSLFSMRAMKEVTDINDVLRVAKPIQLKLRNWYHSLPVELQMNSVQPRKLCSNGYLQLAYFAAELTLHRRIITTLYQQNANGNKVPDELLVVCRTAAKTRLLAAMEFVRDLKPEHIHSFWHSSSSANFTLIGTFAALLFVSSTNKEDAAQFKEHTFNYRWILKISSKGFVQIGDTLRKLDLVLNHVPGLLNESIEQPMMVPNVPTVDYNKIYQQLQQLPKSQQLPPKQLPLLQHLQTLYHLPNLPHLQHLQHLPPNRSAEQRPYAQRYDSSQDASYNNQKTKDVTRPSPAQQYRVPGQQSGLPYENKGYQGQQAGSNARGVLISSPLSSQGYSPRDGARTSKSGLSGSMGYNLNQHTPQDSRSDTPHERRSPVLMKSPLAQHQTSLADEVGR